MSSRTADSRHGPMPRTSEPSLETQSVGRPVRRCDDIGDGRIGSRIEARSPANEPMLLRGILVGWTLFGLASGIGLLVGWLIWG